MKRVNVASVALNQTPLDWTGNVERIKEAVSEALSKGAQVTCLPELCITGYGCEDQFLSPGVQKRAMECLHAVTRANYLNDLSKIWTVGLPVRYRNGVYNCVAVVQNGKVAGLVPKQYLANDGIHYESRWFKEWPKGRVVEVNTPSGPVPMGDLIFQTADGLKIGFEICEDAWSSNRPAADLASRGVDLILNPSASHFRFGKQDVRRGFVLEASRAHKVAYVYANLLGNEAGRIIYDGSTIIASGGDILAEGPRLTYADSEVVCRQIDVERLRMLRTSKRSFRPEQEVEDKGVRLIGLEDARTPRTAPDNPPEWEDSEYHKEEEFTRAVSLGLFDYLRKTGQNGYCVSLSGGADSSATAVLVSTMNVLAGNELGDEYASRLGVDPSEPILTTIYQPTFASSQTTQDAAYDVAESIGARHLVIDVDSVVGAYERIVSEALDVEFDWDSDDVTLQNIQARSRGPSAWMVANKTGTILLAPSNRSEAAVGYATMDGDTCGGLSPLAGIDKAFLRQWLEWMEAVGPEGVDPYPCLESVNVQAPTAELRPQEMEQTDEDDLMPYEILDRIERMLVRDRRTPLEIGEQLASEGYAGEHVVEWVERFFTLWTRNQWKRERYAPSFHLDDENLDPKTGCRYPILSAGYSDDFETLRRKLI